MTNAAYDLSRFDVEERKPNEQAKQARMEVVRSTAAKKGAVVKGLIMSLLVVGVCGVMLFSMVRINELSNQVTAETETLNKLKSEGVVLETRLDSEMSLQNVEDYAINVLGMQKIQTSQMQCINIKTDDAITTTAGNKGIFSAIVNGIDGLMEYLKF